MAASLHARQHEVHTLIVRYRKVGSYRITANFSAVRRGTARWSAGGTGKAATSDSPSAEKSLRVSQPCTPPASSPMPPPPSPHSAIAALCVTSQRSSGRKAPQHAGHTNAPTSAPTPSAAFLPAAAFEPLRLAMLPSSRQMDDARLASAWRACVSSVCTVVSKSSSSGRSRSGRAKSTCACLRGWVRAMSCMGAIRMLEQLINHSESSSASLKCSTMRATS
mmetsp:Transcript_15629/g.48594  ORF Transcript_15629/g.48594 Transcript_15629/m.48594 type:complete len:221 (-) Transcript_15629:761-1423(-)